MARESGMRYVIAVAGPIGGGKTSLVKGIANYLDDATAIHCDSYESLTAESIANVMRWMQSGANTDEIIIPGLPHALENLKLGANVIDPLTGMEIASRKYIIFETNFGREHRATARYIDLLIWIEVPLDIALARNVKAFINTFLERYGKDIYKDCLLWLRGYIDNYLKVVRDLLRIQRERVRATADIIIDGQKEIETIIRHAAQEIVLRLP